MWKWSLNWGEITPTILVGTCPMTPDDLDRIRESAGVSSVLSLQHDDCLAYWNIDYREMRERGMRLGLAMGRCPVRDFDVTDQRRCLPAAVTTLSSLQAQGHRTYVHCTAGLGRAPLTVLGYLTLVAGHSPEHAIGLIHAGRSGAVPAWEAYWGCREDLAARHRQRIERRAYELYAQGANPNSDADWRQAESEVLRSVLLGTTQPIAERR